MIDEETIRNRSTAAVFERGENYRDEGRIQRLDTKCTCPYDGGGDCKHVVAVLLDIAAGPPQDESERVEAVLDDVSADDLRMFVRDALAEHAELREQFLARFSDEHKSVEAYREEIAQLFEQHADPVVFEAIDFSRFFDIAEQYRDCDRYMDTLTASSRPIRLRKNSTRTLACWKRGRRRSHGSTTSSSGAHSTTSRSDTSEEISESIYR